MSLALAANALAAPLETNATLIPRTFSPSPGIPSIPFGISVYRTRKSCNSHSHNHLKHHPQISQVAYNSPVVFDHHFHGFAVSRDLGTKETLYFYTTSKDHPEENEPCVTQVGKMVAGEEGGGGQCDFLLKGARCVILAWEGK